MSLYLPYDGKNPPKNQSENNCIMQSIFSILFYYHLSPILFEFHKRKETQQLPFPNLDVLAVSDYWKTLQTA